MVQIVIPAHLRMKQALKLARPDYLGRRRMIECQARVVTTSGTDKVASLRRPIAVRSKRVTNAGIENCGVNLDALETKAFARRQDQIRIKGLTTARPIVGGLNWTNIGPRLRLLARRHRHLRFPAIDVGHVNDLRGRLRACIADGAAVATLASSMSMRGTRRKFVSALLEAFEPYADDDLRTATVIKRTMTLTPDELSTVSAARLCREFRADLARAGILDMPGPLIAVLHGEFEPTRGVYVLHWHLIATAEKARALHRLKKQRGYVKTATGSNPVVVRRVRNRTGQFSYLLKSYWPERAIRQTENGPKRDRRHRRIAEPFHSQVLLWLDRHRLSDLVLMNGCWSKRSGGSAAMRDLCLIVNDKA